jgi:hypothetical protein
MNTYSSLVPEKWVALEGFPTTRLFECFNELEFLFVQTMTESLPGFRVYESSPVSDSPEVKYSVITPDLPKFARYYGLTAEESAAKVVFLDPVTPQINVYKSKAWKNLLQACLTRIYMRNVSILVSSLEDAGYTSPAFLRKVTLELYTQHLNKNLKPGLRVKLGYLLRTLESAMSEANIDSRLDEQHEGHLSTI